MARTKDYGYNTAATKKNLGLLPISAADLAVLQDEPEECIESTIASPLDRPERWTFGRKTIDNVYKDTGIQLAAKTVSTRGAQILVKHEAITEITDSDTPNVVKQVPMVSYLVVRAPINECIDADDVLLEVSRMLAGAFGDGTDITSGRLANLIRGALKAQ